MKKCNISILKFIMMTIMLVTLFTGCSANSTGINSDSAGMRVHFIDVGQGDSILVEAEEHYMLIDAGENDQEAVVLSYLKNAGVEKLDYVIGTHPHSDHIGSLDAVIRNFDVENVILPEKEYTTQTFEDLLDAIEAKEDKITYSNAGDEYALGKATFTIISQNIDYGDDINNWSVGIRLVFGDTSFVMCGDAETKAEEDMVKAVDDLSADVLKVGHHGSDTSTSDAFLNAVNPTYSVISVGADNDYDHPKEEILNKLINANIKIFRTDEGTVIAESDGKTIKWNSVSKVTVEEMKPTSATVEGNGSRVEANVDKGYTEEIKETEKETNTGEKEYVLNTNTLKFHLPSCNQVNKIKQSNKEIYNGSYEELTGDGYEPCKICLGK